MEFLRTNALSHNVKITDKIIVVVDYCKSGIFVYCPTILASRETNSYRKKDSVFAIIFCSNIKYSQHALNWLKSNKNYVALRKKCFYIRGNIVIHFFCRVRRDTIHVTVMKLELAAG